MVADERDGDDQGEAEGTDGEHPLQGLRALVDAFKSKVVESPSIPGVTRISPGAFQGKDGASGVRMLRSLARSYLATQQAFRSKQAISVNSPTAAGMLIFHLNPAAELVNCADGMVELSRPAGLTVPELPGGYAFKGGVARYALATALRLHRDKRRPRDIDLVRFGDTPSPQDAELAARLSPDDFRAGRGKGVELIHSLESYFATRDLTVNEVVLDGSRVVCTFRCLEDSTNRRFRATPHVCDRQGYPLGITTMKMLRLVAERAVSGERWSIEGKVNNPHVLPFDIALHLERALERGGRVADHYLALCAEHRFLEGCRAVADAVEALEELSPGTTSRLPRLDSLRRKKRGAGKPRLLRR